MKLISKSDLDDVQLSLLTKRFNRFGWWARTIVRPLFVVLFLAPLWHDHEAWRWWILVGGFAIGVLRVLLDFVYGFPGAPPYHRTRPMPLLSPLVGVGLLGCLILATGGFDSPMLPIIVPLYFFICFIATTRVVVVMGIGMAALVWLLAVISANGLIANLIPPLFGGGSHVPQPGVLLYSKAGALSLLVGWAAVISSALRDVSREIVGDAIDARDEVLADHEAHRRELTALSGELAHELKNPLTNIKGLAVLVSREVEGRAAERVALLQGEVDRMEDILQRFLTFSRPLLPLSLEEVDLAELCASVLALHEGMAHERGTTLRMQRTEVVPISCDPRKIKQILINLMQNAIEASPARVAVELSVVSSADGGARVEVVDSGTGVTEAVRAHLFEPGTTTKTRGTGLGLALARGLARQHGGDLTLENRAGGGCTATLTLPPAKSRAAGEVAS